MLLQHLTFLLCSHIMAEPSHPSERNPSLPQQREAGAQLYVRRDAKTAALRQTCGDLPISGILTELIQRD